MDMYKVVHAVDGAETVYIFKTVEDVKEYIKSFNDTYENQTPSYYYEDEIIEVEIGEYAVRNLRKLPPNSDRGFVVFMFYGTYLAIHKIALPVGISIPQVHSILKMMGHDGIENVPAPTEAQ